MTDNTFLRQRAYRIIQNKILRGELRAGSIISELTLAQEIGMSRTPVREAIGQLQREKLFNKVHRIGTIVRSPSFQELKNLYEVRESLESQAALIAANALSSCSLDRLATLIDEVQDIEQELECRQIDALDEELLVRFFNADIAFHLIIVQAAGNAYILDIVNEFRVIQRVFEYERIHHNKRIMKNVVCQHSKILKALRARSGEEAISAMSCHIRASQLEALKSFDVIAPDDFS